MDEEDLVRIYRNAVKRERERRGLVEPLADEPRTLQDYAVLSNPDKRFLRSLRISTENW
tara:strand:+ start:922 stop:1098 length:177 start_codon:yes stop_codon:yes gene_type:complete